MATTSVTTGKASGTIYGPPNAIPITAEVVEGKVKDVSHLMQ